MKVQVRIASDAQEFIRQRMLETMNRSVVSMRQSGCSEESIQALVDDTEQKIAEVSIEVDDVFAALQQNFNKVFN